MTAMTRRESIAAIAALMLFSGPASAQEHQGPPRDSWQRVEDVFRELGITTGSHVADLGAGGGYFTSRLARAVGPTGRVYAVDVNPITLRELKEALPKDLTNIEIVRGEENDPKVPAGSLDAVLVVNAYHEFAEYAAVLARVKEALKPGGRLVLIEPRPRRADDTTRPAQTKRHTLAMEFALADLSAAGFEVVKTDQAFVTRPEHQDGNSETVKPVDWLLVARRPGGSQPF